MAELVSLQTILTYLTLISVPIGVFYHIMMLRNSQKARQTEMLMRLHESKHDKEGLEAFFRVLSMDWKDLEDYQEKYGPYSNPEMAAIMESQVSYFEGLGVLVKDRTVDLNTVYSIMGRRIIQTWYKLEKLIKDLREMARGPGPDYSESFEYLANELIKIRKQKGLPLYEDRLHPTSTLHHELKA